MLMRVENTISKTVYQATRQPIGQLTVVQDNMKTSVSSADYQFQVGSNLKRSRVCGAPIDCWCDH